LLSNTNTTDNDNGDDGDFLWETSRESALIFVQTATAMMEMMMTGMMTGIAKRKET